MSKTLVYIGIILSILLGVAAIVYFKTQPKPSGDISCTVDNDCKIVSVGSCCEFISVNKDETSIQSTPQVCARNCPVTAKCVLWQCTVVNK